MVERITIMITRHDKRLCNVRVIMILKLKLEVIFPTRIIRQINEAENDTDTDTDTDNDNDNDNENGDETGMEREGKHPTQKRDSHPPK